MNSRGGDLGVKRYKGEKTTVKGYEGDAMPFPQCSKKPPYISTVFWGGGVAGGGGGGVEQNKGEGGGA